jgi:hypothetical protein
MNFGLARDHFVIGLLPIGAVATPTEQESDPMTAHKWRHTAIPPRSFLEWIAAERGAREMARIDPRRGFKATRLQVRHYKLTYSAAVLLPPPC